MFLGKTLNLYYASLQSGDDTWEPVYSLLGEGEGVTLKWTSIQGRVENTGRTVKYLLKT